MASQKLATSLMDKGFIREIRAKPDRARGLFGSKSVADEVQEVAHILLQTWSQQVSVLRCLSVPSSASDQESKSLDLIHRSLSDFAVR
ncbi:MAG: hypothetical protein CR217_11900 [Beijerinckiaceae bacterium]|nr:MAG: hypothetical protein CR217_11900 [Beijerinckiaceae bacterium]